MGAAGNRPLRSSFDEISAARKQTKKNLTDLRLAGLISSTAPNLLEESKYQEKSEFNF